MSWLVLLMVGLAAAQTEDVEEMTVTMTMPVPTTEEIITEYSLKLYHLESATSSITIAWRAKIPENVTVEKYHVRTVKHGSESEIIGPDLPGNAKGYIIEDLIKESEWHICVIASLTNNSLSQEHTECMDSFTIPYIRPDSMYVLAIVVAVIVFLILCGYCSWRRAVSNAEKAEEDEAEPGDDESEEGKLLKPTNAKPILLSPVDNSPDRPKSSIEDEDIPYITPPWSEIEREKQEKLPLNNSA